MNRRRSSESTAAVHPRRGASTVDYALTLALVFPIVGFSMTAGRQLLQQTFEMIVMLISWPFM